MEHFEYIQMPIEDILQSFIDEYDQWHKIYLHGNYKSYVWTTTGWHPS